jgi:hypothetical protein
MTHFNIRNFIVIAALSAIAQAAYGDICLKSDSGQNTACGTDTLNFPPASGLNSAFGYGALASTTGSENTATGMEALYSNTDGADNTASGYQALYSNVMGIENTAVGVWALYSSQNQEQNTAVGFQALYANASGSSNTAVGASALFGSQAGSQNTAVGWVALDYIVGSYNTGVGSGAAVSGFGNNNTAVGAYTTVGLNNTTGGSNNSVFGSVAGVQTGSNNVLLGYGAGADTAMNAVSLVGSNNIAVGALAGSSWNTGSNNIAIGNVGASGESGIIRIGTTKVQTAAYVAGITDSHLFGRLVVISDNGQLGVLGSSERFKTDIAPMGSNTAKIDELRPVTFRLKTDPHGPIQYGLIAEEVAKVFPELVTRDAQGKVDGVRYEELAPMLLNEVQKQAGEIRDLKKLVVNMQAGLMKLQAKDELLAQR